MGNVVVIDSVVAGVGTSTLAALLARELSERGLKCVLVDADLQGGGLDVLLGVENEDGSRFGEISAPLGNIDGKALLCIHALSQVRSVVVVDMGQWNGLQDLTELRKAIRITVVELTVLGLARAKANLRAHYGSIGEHDAATQEREFLVGVQPRGTVRDHGLDCANPIVRTRKPSQRWRISFRKRWEKRASVMELGPLSDIASEPGVTDIAVTCDGTVWVDRGQGMRPHALRVPFSGPQAIRDFAVRLCSQLGRRLDDACPIADASTVEGVRVHAVIAPLVPQGAAISIRLPDVVAPSLESLAENGMFPSGWMPLLEGFVERRASVLVTGGTGAGKTTLLKAMLMRCAPGERVITVEEVRELGMLNHANHVSLVTRGANMEGKGAIGLSQLICATLRMRPDRIVVGECRGGEIVDLLRALNSGHRGGMTTLHANQVTAVPSRLVALGLLSGLNPQATAALAQDAFDVVLHVGRVGGRRRIAQIGRLEFAEGKLRGNLLAGWNGNQMRASQQWPDFVRAWSR